MLFQLAPEMPKNLLSMGFQPKLSAKVKPISPVWAKAA